MRNRQEIESRQARQVEILIKKCENTIDADIDAKWTKHTEWMDSTFVRLPFQVLQGIKNIYEPNGFQVSWKEFPDARWADEGSVKIRLGVPGSKHIDED